ncbi:hypothetical protein, partial [Alistipes putredinis]
MASAHRRCPSRSSTASRAATIRASSPKSPPSAT